MAASINRVVLVGNLTRDPELRHTPSGMAVCSLRIAVNSRQKEETGQWARSRTTSRSPSGATRARAARSTCRRAAPSPSTGVSTGASTRRTTGRSARRSRSSPTPSSSSAAVAAATAGAAAWPQFVPASAQAARGGLPARRRRRRHPLLERQAWQRRRNGASAPATGTGEAGGSPASSARTRSTRGGLQERQPAPAVHLREGEDPLAARHRRVPAPSGAGRGRGQAGPRDGAAAVRLGVAMDVILLSDVEKLGLKGEVVDVERRLRPQLPPAAPARRGGDARRVAELADRRGAGAPRGAVGRAGGGDRGHAAQDGAPLRGEGRADGGALRLRHLDERRRRDLAHPEDPRRPPQDRARRSIKRIGRYSIPIHGLRGREAEVKTIVVPEGGDLPPEEELAALEAAERAEAEAAERAHEEAVRATEAALAEEEAAWRPPREAEPGDRPERPGRPTRARASDRGRALRGPSFVPQDRPHRPRPCPGGCGRATRKSPHVATVRSLLPAPSGGACPALGIEWEHVFRSSCSRGGSRFGRAALLGVSALDGFDAPR